LFSPANRIQNRFPDREIGAMPPFGNLYGMPVLAEESLAKDKEIAFNAGTHSELIRLSWGDFVRLVKPKVLDFDVVTPHGSHASYSVSLYLSSGIATTAIHVLSSPQRISKTKRSP
jgi:Aminoacyl-tRNA editing domain